MAASTEAFPPLPLPEGITVDYIDCAASCGLKFHVLKAGRPGDPLVLFTHGYPELAYSWRKVLPAVAKADYFCVAPDQRGYGRTTGWAHQSFEETDLSDYLLTNLVRDLVCLVTKLGYEKVHSIVGHDFGAVSSATAALIRPDMFLSTVQMSHPYHPPPSPPSGGTTPNRSDIVAGLAALDPPRKHYKWYNSSAPAAHDWISPPQGLEAFLRGYFHLKSADWEKNEPRPLEKWAAEQLVEMPEYYIMRADQTMATVVEKNMVGEDPAKTEGWLSKEELVLYCAEWNRTGFQGALNWYRAQTTSIQQDPMVARDMWLFAGRRIEVPVVFISGAKDWGNYQQPGALGGYEDDKLVKKGMFRGVKMVEGAGHWVQQEQPEVVAREILEFFKTLQT
ncbi:Alpha/Beta hydrolase protein [Podospora australis]|uniref:Alpha/Beta hydrolase protein n=1 Tax=Podospora australis TaxID=1536484 RepID=A0AAN7AGT0_9PEZI|nr:Alpha/Beta hydrolase protein [Podospora australis]